MKLLQYLKHRNKSKSLNCLSNKELDFLGIKQGTRGWLEEHYNRELSTTEITTLVKLVVNNKNIQTVVKNNLKPLLMSSLSKYDNQLLYLMKSDTGLYKIGISLDPEKRAKVLSCASGFKVSVVGSWKVECAVRELEDQVHNTFHEYRVLGEWFNFEDSFSLVDIEQVLFVNYIRIHG